MSRRDIFIWAAIAAVVAVALLFFALPAGAQSFDFMPPGGRALLVKELGAPGKQARLQEVAQSRKTEPEWQAAFPDLSPKERATLAAYLAGNMPLAGAPAAADDLVARLPPDGRELAINECQSCHSLFTSYLTQSRDAQGWRNIFLSPFHRQMKLSPQQREEFARYSALNMPMKVTDVPEDLRF